MPVTMVVDASVAVKLYVPEVHSDRAEAFFHTVEEGETLLVAPDLIYPETGNILRRKHRAAELNAAEAKEIAESILALPLAIEPSRPILPLALDLSIAFGITVYDALYLSLAAVYDTRLMTADRKLVNALAKTPMRNHVTWLGEQ